MISASRIEAAGIIAGERTDMGEDRSRARYAESIAGGVVYALLNRLRLKSPRPFLSAATGRDVLNGLSIVPMLFLAFGVVSTPALTAVLHFNRLILAAAALSALFAILEET